MTPVAAPPRVRERLRSAPDGPVPLVHVGADATYVEVAGWCVGVVGPRAVKVPCALRLPDADPRVGNLAEGVGQGVPVQARSAYLEGGTLHLDGRPLSVGRAVAVRAPRNVIRRTSRTTANSATVMATPPAAVVEFVSTHLPAGRVDAQVADDLLGRGPGLTPLGDDVLAGWLAVHRVTGVATPDVDEVLASARERTTLLSATLLDCADHGEVVPQFGDWLAALARDDAERALADLIRVGATSGAGLAVGAAAALTSLDPAPGRTP